MRDIKQALTNVNSDALQLFKDATKDIIKEFGIEESLERALACMSGYT